MLLLLSRNKYSIKSSFSAIPESVTDARFTATPPQYIWYDKTDRTKSSSNAVSCDGGVPRGTVTFSKYVYRNGDRLSYPPLTVDASTTSGVYQCVINEAASKSVWLQQSTEIVVAGKLELLMLYLILYHIMVI